MTFSDTQEKAATSKVLGLIPGDSRVHTDRLRHHDALLLAAARRRCSFHRRLVCASRHPDRAVGCLLPGGFATQCRLQDRLGLSRRLGYL